MKIQTIHFYEVGAITNSEINLVNDWDDTTESKVLLSGTNGSGKSTVLRAISMLWDALGYWLDHRKPLPRNHIAREWLQRWGGCAIVFNEATHSEQSIGLIFGEIEWCEKIQNKHSDVAWIGEGVARTGKVGNPKREMFVSTSAWVDKWSDLRKKLILSFDKVDLPNVVFLDAEERRWVSPRRNVGEHLAEQPALRWLPRYIATEDWRGQLESSLITLKTTQLHAYHDLIRDMNAFLSGKEIDPDIKQGENRLRVKIKNQRGQTHSLDDLSAGEHQVLILIYLLSRWAQQGAIVLIDEPDLYLHPSLVNGLLSSLEKLVSDFNGQLIITSHQPEIWRRYEKFGKRIELGARI